MDVPKVFSRMKRVEPAAHRWADGRSSPLLFVEYPAVIDEQDITSFFDTTNEWQWHVKDPWAIVMDFSKYSAATSTSAKRRAFIRGARLIGPGLGKHCIGIAVVTPNALMRGVATAVLWIYQPPCPLQLFSSVDAGVEWLGQIAEKQS